MASSDKLSLGLDEIIRMNRGSSNRRGGNRPMRGRPNRTDGNVGFRNRGGGGLPRASNPANGGRWKPDFSARNSNQNRGGAERTSGVNSTTKLLISNLDPGVTTDDIQELFQEIGAVRSARVHFDENGQSLGTAEVIYERRVDAVAARQKYNTLNLDGRPMQIDIVGGSDTNRTQPARFQNSGRNQRGGFRNNNSGNNRGRGAGRGQQQQQQPQRQNAKKEEVTMEDLDADLDAYRAQNKEKK